MVGRVGPMALGGMSGTRRNYRITTVTLSIGTGMQENHSIFVSAHSEKGGSLSSWTAETHNSSWLIIQTSK